MSHARPFTYGSVCSGIEAASVAWHPLGWQAAWFSEIEPFACSVLDYRWPHVPNLGDMTKLTENATFNSRPIDLLVGGTPCQSFSVAGLRKGLDDPRGNLALEFLRIADRKRPRWVVWENVPGVLSSWSDAEEDSQGDIWQSNDFDTFLAGLRYIGYGVAYRVLDAQFFGVPQRRRRVFVVGCLGDAAAARAVLFERHGLFGHLAQSQAAGQEPPRRAFSGFGGERDVVAGHLIPTATYRWQNDVDGLVPDDVAATLKKSGHSTDERHVAAYVVNAEGSEGLPFLTRSNGAKGVNNQTPLVYQANQSGAVAESEVVGTLLRNNTRGVSHQVSLVFTQNQREECRIMEVAGTLSGSPGTHQQNFVARPVQDTADTLTANWHRSNGAKAGNNAGMVNPVIGKGTVRRLTPVECERLQGFPDHYTLVPGKFLPKKISVASRWWADTHEMLLSMGVDVSGVEFEGRDFGPIYRPRKPQDYAETITYLLHHGFTLQEAHERANCPDGPRYAAIGNSMAVPVMRWLGERIQAVDQILQP